ncbi:MAG: hypothetical protein ABIH25_02680 [Candidatus Woesearchaeota archaeon]
MDKKGETMMVIVKAIVVIALVAILFYFFVEFVVIGRESADREVCRTSVLLAGKTQIIPGTELKCKTDFKTIKTDDVDEIKMEITQEMYDCWYQYGEGKVNFMKHFEFSNNGEKIFVCSRIDFKEGVDKKITGFSDFWATKSLPFKNDMTFYEYFYGSGVTDPDVDITLSTEEPVYVIYLATKSNLLTWAEKHPIGGSLFLGAVVVGIPLLAGVPVLIAPGVAILGGVNILGTKYSSNLLVGNADTIMDLLGYSVEIRDGTKDNPFTTGDETKIEEFVDNHREFYFKAKDTGAFKYDSAKFYFDEEKGWMIDGSFTGVRGPREVENIGGILIDSGLLNDEIKAIAELIVDRAGEDPDEEIEVIDEKVIFQDLTLCRDDEFYTCGQEYIIALEGGASYTCCGRKSTEGYTCKIYSSPQKNYVNVCKGQLFHLVSNPSGVSEDCDWDFWEPCCNGDSEPDCISGIWRCDKTPCP